MFSSRSAPEEMNFFIDDMMWGVLLFFFLGFFFTFLLGVYLCSNYSFVEGSEWRIFWEWARTISFYCSLVMFCILVLAVFLIDAAGSSISGLESSNPSQENFLVKNTSPISNGGGSSLASSSATEEAGFAKGSSGNGSYVVMGLGVVASFLGAFYLGVNYRGCPNPSNTESAGSSMVDSTYSMMEMGAVGVTQSFTGGFSNVSDSLPDVTGNGIIDSVVLGARLGDAAATVMSMPGSEAVISNAGNFSEVPKPEFLNTGAPRASLSHGGVSQRGSMPEETIELDPFAPDSSASRLYSSLFGRAPILSSSFVGVPRFGPTPHETIDLDSFFAEVAQAESPTEDLNLGSLFVEVPQAKSLDEDLNLGSLFAEVSQVESLTEEGGLSENSDKNFSWADFVSKQKP